MQNVHLRKMAKLDSNLKVSSSPCCERRINSVACQVVFCLRDRHQLSIASVNAIHGNSLEDFVPLSSPIGHCLSAVPQTHSCSPAFEPGMLEASDQPPASSQWELSLVRDAPPRNSAISRRMPSHHQRFEEGRRGHRDKLSIRHSTRAQKDGG